jgi:SAM-dependent methyltransferase
MFKKIKFQIQLHLSIPLWRYIVGKIRFIYFYYIKQQINTLETGNAVKNTISHNFKNLSTFGFTRMDKIIKPLSVIETLNASSTFLIIGPRNEEDLLNLCGNGFQLKHIKGLDLISYSPKIIVGDMHNIPYDSNSFDCVICGWTLPYSNNQTLACNEILRVVKPNGIIAISLEYSTLTDENVQEKLKYTLSDQQHRITNTNQLLNYFKNNIQHIYFNHDAPNKISHTVEQNFKNVSAIVAIFSVSK